MFHCWYSNVVYKSSWGRFNATSYGETWWHLSIRVGEHSGVSPLTGTTPKSKKSIAVKGEMLFWNHIVSIADYKVLATSDSDLHLKGKGNLLIWRAKPILNKNENPLHLYLFEWSLPHEIIFQWYLLLLRLLY